MAPADHAERLTRLGRRRTKLESDQAQLASDLRVEIVAAHAAGISAAEIAERVGISRQAVYSQYLRER